MASLSLHGTTILACAATAAPPSPVTARSRWAQTVVKQGARKIRRLHNGQVLAGFAGLDAPTPWPSSRSSRRKLEEYRGNLERAAVELARGLAHRPRRCAGSRPSWSWLTASVVPAVGSGGRHRPRRRSRRRRERRALRPGRGPRPRASHQPSTLGALALEAMKIAAGICIYTNDAIVVETLCHDDPPPRSQRGAPDPRRPHAPRDRGRAGPPRRRTGRGQAGRRDRAAKPHPRGSASPRRPRPRSRRRTSS